MLVCAMNPCKCGWFGHVSGRCRCSPRDIEKYHAKISGPLLDRIDIMVEVSALEFDELRAKRPAEPSADIRQRVNAARERQRERLGGGTSCNSRMSQAEMREFCELDEAGETLLRQAFERMGLTARSHDRILRVARTIADLEGAERIAPHHLAEAIQYRTDDFRDGNEEE
jgi:magnesium chelatase family protein